MKKSAGQETIEILNNSRDTENDRQLSLQSYIDNHYKCDVFESRMNEEFVIMGSKLNKSPAFLALN
jgi:hypothetical protein